MIANYVHPGSLLDFCCVCSRFLYCSSKALESNQHLATLHLDIHDRDPVTLPKYLRKCGEGDVSLWFVRRLEIWTARQNFQDWVSPSFAKGNPYARGTVEWLNWPEKHMDLRHLEDTGFFHMREPEKYDSVLMENLMLSSQYSEVSRLERGADDIAKVLLMALAPRLREIVFINASLNPQHLSDIHSLKFLGIALRGITHLEPSSWQHFQGLEEITIRHRSTFTDSPETFRYNFSDVAPIFLPPNVKRDQIRP